MMLEVLNKFLGAKYNPLNKIKISGDNLVFNYKTLSALDPNIKIAPVLKSNAYGHGISAVGRILDKLHPPFLCVDSLYEGYELLKAGIKSSILITGYVNPENLKIKKLPFSYAAYEKNTLEDIHRYQPQAGIHIFVDTGMHREGVEVSGLSRLLGFVKSLPKIRIEGLMSHFASGDDPDNPLSQKQADEFVRSQEICREFGIYPKWFHIAASSALLNHEKFKGKLGNLARAGAVIYGIDPAGKFKGLRPVLSLFSTISQIKKVKSGEKIGYDFTFKAEKDMTIGILPIGYNDGVDRRLSNKGCVYVKGRKCPIVGRISMNITTVDVSSVENPNIGDEAEIFSNDLVKENFVSDAANICETIPYDLLIRLNGSTSRLVV